MLVEMAIGDAYGAGFEYAPRDLVESRNDLSGYVRHPRHKITPGCYTDDTQMSLALAEAIVEGDDWTALALARRFVEVFRRDPRPGYAQGYSDFIRSVRDEHEFLDRIKPDSEKSGAAMRASPIGVLSDTSRVIERATSQASITHNTYTGIRSACAAALMTHYFLYRLGAKAGLIRFLNETLPDLGLRPWAGKVGSKGLMSVAAAATVVSQYDSMTRILLESIAYTGDVDTVATISLAAGSCSDEVDQDLPDHLRNGLENGRYGHDYLQQLDGKLLSFVLR